MRKLLYLFLCGGLFLASCSETPLLGDFTNTVDDEWKVSDEDVIDFSDNSFPDAAMFRGGPEPGDGTTEYIALIADTATRWAELAWVKTYYLAGFDTVFAYTEIPSNGYGIYGPRYTTCTYPTYSCGPDTTWYGPATQLPTEVAAGDPYSSLGVTITWDGDMGGEPDKVNHVDHFRSTRNPDGTYQYELSFEDHARIYIMNDYRAPKLVGRNEIGGEILYQNFWHAEPDGAKRKVVVSWQNDNPEF